MNQSTLKAAIKVLFDRWPWPDDTEEFQHDYVKQLQLATAGWSEKRTDAFKKAVSAALADTHRGRARPSVDDLVASALSRAGEGAKPSNELAPKDLLADRERRRMDWERECARRRADPAEAARAAESFMRGASLWRSGSNERIHIAEWLRDFWGVEATPEEFRAFVHGPSSQRPRSPRAQKPEKGDLPPTVGAVLATIAGPHGLSDKALDAHDKHDRRADHRARVKNAIRDFHEKSRDPDDF